MVINNPEQVLWNAYSSHMDIFCRDPHNRDAKETADYYFDQWMKLTEKRVVAELHHQKVKQTKGDKLPKIKPRADKLKS